MLALPVRNQHLGSLAVCAARESFVQVQSWRVEMGDRTAAVAVLQRSELDWLLPATSRCCRRVALWLPGMVAAAQKMRCAKINAVGAAHEAQLKSH